MKRESDFDPLFSHVYPCIIHPLNAAPKVTIETECSCAHYATHHSDNPLHFYTASLTQNGSSPITSSRSRAKLLEGERLKPIVKQAVHSICSCMVLFEP